MASVLRSSPAPFDNFTRTSHGYGNDFEPLNHYGGSSQGSSSYGAAMELSPSGDQAMEINFSEFFGGDDLLGMGFDGQASVPMSTDTSDYGFSMSMGDSTAATVSTSIGQAGRTSTASSAFFPVDSRTQAGRDSRLIYQAHRSFPSVTVPSNANNGGWAFSGPPALDFAGLDAPLYDEPPSASSSFTPQSSYQAPWSPEQPRIHGSLGADINLFGPASEYRPFFRNNYAQSAFSWESSSPRVAPIHTPSSSRSPVSSHANLSQGGRSPPTLLSNTVSPQSIDKTPRASQAQFGQNQNRDPSFDFTTKAEPSSPPSATSRALSIDRSSNVDAPNSPASDFVWVADPGSYKESSPTPVDAKPLISTSPSTLQPPQTVFVAQVFSANEDGSSQSSSSNGRAIRRPSGKRAGGRSLGMHLAPDKAARAKILREEGSCWLCCLQRDSCTPGEICDRCIKRSQRATLEHGLGCDRTKLTELKVFFIPDIISRLHTHDALKAWCGEHIRRWSGINIKLKMHVIWDCPPIECELYEFEPKTRELLRDFQWIRNPETGRMQRLEKPSPPLAMVQIEHCDRQRYDRYLNKVVDNYLEKFAERCFDGAQDDFQGRLLRMMIRLKPDNKEEAALLRDIYRLLVVTYIMCRKATLAPAQRPLLNKLHSYRGRPEAYGWATSPRMANRQLKFLWHSLLTNIMDTVLKRLQQILRSSKGGAKWTSAFCSILGLAMCFEYIQRLTHLVCDDPVIKASFTEQEMEIKAETACRLIDDKFQFISNLFRWKYHRGFNPLKDWTDEKVQRTLGDGAVDFVRGVTGLVVEKYENYLCERQHVGISNDNVEKYTSRLVARFLLSFWSPQ